MSVNRLTLCIAFGIALLLAAWLMRWGVVDSAFVEPGHFAFASNEHPRVDQMKWLDDCDGDRFPDFAVVFRKERSLYRRAINFMGLASLGRQVVAHVYSGRTGKLLHDANFPRFPGRCIEIRDFHSASEELSTVHNKAGRISLYVNGERVSTHVNAPSRLFAYWDLEKKDAWVATAELLDLVPDGHSRLLSVGMAVDPSTQKRVFVAFIERRSRDSCAGGWVWLDYNTAKLLKAERTYWQDLSQEVAERWKPARVGDFDQDGLLDCEYVDRDYVAGLNWASQSYMRINGAEVDVPQYSIRDDRVPQFASDLTELDNYDRPVRFNSIAGDGRRLKLSMLRPHDLSLRIAGELPELSYLPKVKPQPTVTELDDLNGDRYHEYGVNFTKSKDGSWEACSVLLDGATLRLFDL